MQPIESHHHLKFEDRSLYREGVVLKRPTKSEFASWVEIGLGKQVPPSE